MSKFVCQFVHLTEHLPIVLLIVYLHSFQSYPRLEANIAYISKWREIDIILMFLFNTLGHTTYALKIHILSCKPGTRMKKFISTFDNKSSMNKIRHNFSHNVIKNKLFKLKGKLVNV